VPSDGEADDCPAHRGEHEHLSGTAPAVAAIATRSAVSAVASLSSLPGQDRHEPSGKAQLATNSGGRDGVGWRDDRAEGETCSQGEARDQRPRGKPTAAVVASTSPTDSSVIARTSLRKLRTELDQAA
jgi:hypothetical protein